MKRKSIIAGVSVLAVILVVVLFVVVWKDKELVTVFMKGEGGKIGDTIVIDVKVSDIPGEYQASSFVIHFDNQKLKFKGLKQGNVATVGKSSGSTVYPEWQYDVDSANTTGEISTMYLDMTAGEQPFSSRGFRKKKQDVLFRVEFEILTTCAVSDKLSLEVLQATFASVDEKMSLTLQNEKILAESYQITVKE